MGSVEAEATPQDACRQEHTTQADVSGLIFAIFAVASEDLNATFIGLQVQMGFGLVDAGARRAVCGEKQFQGPVKYLGEVFGLKPIPIPLLEMDAMGAVAQ